ncbi:hypothetical protein NPIL_105781 [Nephila pilipes]|uniref:Uncharacterized protein n=1 Tax=Nephila pilipes TaxID=299642 RepID=A0A8X6I386_NEPPI|nr:hypothetical protein NPIL_105781 [Nephila pilipes]
MSNSQRQSDSGSGVWSGEEDLDRCPNSISVEYSIVQSESFPSRLVKERMLHFMLERMGSREEGEPIIVRVGEVRSGLKKAGFTRMMSGASGQHLSENFTGMEKI